MKNKKLFYVLLPLAIIVWGIIFYKIYTRINDSHSSSEVRQIFKPKEEKLQEDTLQLLTNYSDPFLKNSTIIYSRGATENRGSSSNRQVLNKGNLSNQRMPEIQYYGLISNSKNKCKIGLFKLKGTNIILKEGETANHEVLINKLYKDSVRITFQNLRISIFRST